ncbi:MAG: hypothetical protein NVS4B11_32140 [Ktedonobacteraceae bacterium]
MPLSLTNEQQIELHAALTPTWNETAWYADYVLPMGLASERHDPMGADRWASAKVELNKGQDGVWHMRQTEGVRPYESKDPDSLRIFWREAGVHQNLTFPVHLDPVSGMHCWHQKVIVTPANTSDRYGDISVDPSKAYEVHQQWMSMTRPQTNRPDGLRRPLWMLRPYRPATSAFKRELPVRG